MLSYIFILMLISILSTVCSNMIMWWSLMVMLSIVLLMQSINQKMFNPSINYFLIQETMGLFFISWSMIGSSLMMNMILMVKMGLPPFHFWINKIYSSLTNFLFLWIMNLQKIPLALMMMEMINFSTIKVLILGMILAFSNLMITESVKQILLISSSGSFSIPLMTSSVSTKESVIMMILYTLSMYLMLQNSEESEEMNQTTSLILILMSIPLTIIFMLKISLIFNLSETLFLLPMITLMILSVVSYMKILQKATNSEEDWQESMSKPMIYILPLLILTL